MTHAVLGGLPTSPCSTVAVSKCRNTVSAAFSLWPSPSQMLAIVSCRPFPVR